MSIRHARQWHELCSSDRNLPCSVHRPCSGLSPSALRSKILEFVITNFFYLAHPWLFCFTGQLLLIIVAVEIVDCCIWLICAVNILTHLHGKYFCQFFFLLNNFHFGYLPKLANTVFVLCLIDTWSHSLGGNWRRCQSPVGHCIAVITGCQLWTRSSGSSRATLVILSGEPESKSALCSSLLFLLNISSFTWRFGTNEVIKMS